MRPEEDDAKGLFPKNSAAGYTLNTHVRNGSRLKTQYISSTKSLEKAMEWALKDGCRIAKIDANQIKGVVYDLTLEANRLKFLTTKPARDYAKGSAEVVIEGHVPPKAILEIFTPK